MNAAVTNDVFGGATATTRRFVHAAVGSDVRMSVRNSAGLALDNSEYQLSCTPPFPVGEFAAFINPSTAKVSPGAAKKYLDEIAKDGETPAGVRARADVISALIAGTGKG